ncbi:hypothetical protein EDF59_107160 [Novosphingobium sp. ST904]|nr:hypothetical protein EDF59_107160 [Novosphingobium sp. ST904]
MTNVDRTSGNARRLDVMFILGATAALWSILIGIILLII